MKPYILKKLNNVLQNSKKKYSGIFIQYENIAFDAKL